MLRFWYAARPAALYWIGLTILANAFIYGAYAVIGGQYRDFINNSADPLRLVATIAPVVIFLRRYQSFPIIHPARSSSSPEPAAELDGSAAQTAASGPEPDPSR